MKNMFLAVSMLLMFSTNSMAAQLIQCAKLNETAVVIKLEEVEINSEGHSVYSLAIDDSLKTSYDDLEDRTVTTEISPAKADVLSDFDGNSLIEISFRKGFVTSPVGTQSKAFVKAIYRDIVNETVSTPVRCVILR